eukprot:scaffold84275_cov22-Tisochrysis_lutea.AAC.1
MGVAWLILSQCTSMVGREVRRNIARRGLVLASPPTKPPNRSDMGISSAGRLAARGAPSSAAASERGPSSRPRPARAASSFSEHGDTAPTDLSVAVTEPSRSRRSGLGDRDKLLPRRSKRWAGVERSFILRGEAPLEGELTLRTSSSGSGGHGSTSPTSGSFGRSRLVASAGNFWREAGRTRACCAHRSSADGMCPPAGFVSRPSALRWMGASHWREGGRWSRGWKRREPSSENFRLRSRRLSMPPELMSPLSTSEPIGCTSRLRSSALSVSTALMSPRVTMVLATSGRARGRPKLLVSPFFSRCALSSEPGCGSERRRTLPGAVPHSRRMQKRESRGSASGAGGSIARRETARRRGRMARAWRLFVPPRSSLASFSPSLRLVALRPLSLPRCLAASLPLCARAR